MKGYSVELKDLVKVYGGDHGDPRVGAVNGINLGIHPGEFFTLLGPSGCGKTTTLRLVGGFETPTSGEVYIEGQAMSHVPPYNRPVNTVFQNYALFPHLTVAQNVAFGLAIKRVDKKEQERRVQEALEMVRLPDVGKRKPAQLSGGQQQRVALARALINEPSVLLLDEPLGALDLKLRKAMQIELKQLQKEVGITFIYVTHDQEEALTMSDRIAVMAEGSIIQVGDPVGIYEQPATRFVANFIGESNFIEGVLGGTGSDGAVVEVGAERALIRPDAEPWPAGTEVTVCVRPEKLMLYPPATECNGLSGTVREVIYIGTDTEFVVELANGVRAVARLQNIDGRGLGEFAVGDAVRVGWAMWDAHTLED